MAQFLALVPQLLQLLLFLLMLGMGMTLTLENFCAVTRYPKAVAIGLSNQVIALPLLALLVVTIVPMRPEIAMGLMVVSACPGGATSNLITHLSRGDTALSITLTAVSSLITVLTIPFIINFSLTYLFGSAGQDIHLPVFTTILNIIKLTALPVALGMWINHRFPDFCQRARPAISWGAGSFVLIALALIIFKLNEIGSVWEFVLAAGLGVLCLNLLTYGLGYTSARLLKLNRPQATAISIETGMQNNVLGMAIATAPTMLNNPQMATAAGVYGIIMCTLGVFLVYFFRQANRSEGARTSS